MRQRIVNVRRAMGAPLLAVVLSTGACRTTGEMADGGSVPAATAGWPELPDSAVTPQTSQPLGVFATEAEAVAAARAASLAPSVYGLALIGDKAVAITATGKVYAREPFRGTVAPSGPAQRPPDSPN